MEEQRAEEGGACRKLEKFISALPPPITARIPAPADVADNSRAAAAAHYATAFNFHVKAIRPTLSGCRGLLLSLEGMAERFGLFRAPGASLTSPVPPISPQLESAAFLCAGS